MNDERKSHLMKFLSQGKRYDGRGLEEFREIIVEKGISKNAEGSARVTIGNTEIMAGVKMSIEKPYPDTPHEGNLMVGAELSPLSSPKFESGPPGPESIELARVVDRGIRESKAIDNKALCLTPGEKVWTVMVDIVTINADGNLTDAASLGAIAAIKEARFPTYDGLKIDYKARTTQGLPIKKIPIAVTVFKIGKYLIVDPTAEEEELMDARLTVTSADGKIAALQKGGEYPLTLEEVEQMASLGIAKAKELSKYL
jgi:exosome complex component RRP42